MNPMAWWKSLPDSTKEPIKSAFVSGLWSALTVMGTLFGAYFADHPAGDASAWGGFFWYLLSPHSIGALAAGVAMAYRAKQASTRVANTVQLETGETAVLQSPKKGTP